jgi:predicted RNA-binding protein (virulence factor B family)
MQKIFLSFISIACSHCLFAQNPFIQLRIHPYSDSVKIVPMLSYFVNVESMHEDNVILPVSENDVVLTTTFGRVEGLSIFFTNQTPPDSFVVKVEGKTKNTIGATKVLYVQKTNKDAQINTPIKPYPIDSSRANPTQILPKKKKKKFF